MRRATSLSRQRPAHSGRLRQICSAASPAVWSRRARRFSTRQPRKSAARAPNGASAGSRTHRRPSVCSAAPRAGFCAGAKQNATICRRCFWRAAATPTASCVRSTTRFPHSWQRSSISRALPKAARFSATSTAFYQGSCRILPSPRRHRLSRTSTPPSSASARRDCAVPISPATMAQASARASGTIFCCATAWARVSRHGTRQSPPARF